MPMTLQMLWRIRRMLRLEFASQNFQVQSVCAVATQGYSKNSAWTTSYKVHHSKDGVTLKSYKENNVNKVTKIIYSCLGVEIYKEIIKLSQ